MQAMLDMARLVADQPLVEGMTFVHSVEPQPVQEMHFLSTVTAIFWK